MAKQAIGVVGEDMLSHASGTSAFLKSHANENRLMILCSLIQGEMNVSDLETHLGIRQPTLSQQLARLRADGMVETRRDTKSLYYSLTSDEALEIIRLLYRLFCDSPENESACVTLEAIPT